MSFNVNDEVQVVKDNEIREGVVLELFPPTNNFKPKDYWMSKYSQEEKYSWSEHALVKWTDGTESKVRTESLQQRDSEMERTFRNEAKAVGEKIRAKLSEASKALYEACDEADKAGIPYRFHISPLAQTYTPESFYEKFPGLDRNFAGELSSYPGEYGSGWEHSAVC